MTLSSNRAYISVMCKRWVPKRFDNRWKIAAKHNKSVRAIEKEK